MLEYNPKRIERTINRFENDREKISKQVQKNFDEIGQLMRDVDQANDRIAELTTENKTLNTAFQQIGGKISGLKLVLNGEIDPEE